MSRFSGPVRLSPERVAQILTGREIGRLLIVQGYAWHDLRAKVTDEFARADDGLRRAVWDAEDDAVRWGMKRH